MNSFNGLLGLDGGALRAEWARPAPLRRVQNEKVKTRSYHSSCWYLFETRRAGGTVRRQVTDVLAAAGAPAARRRLSGKIS
ncbi:hypothetical protein EVAR_43331_1 [Eumeta japonica]|uniref:Uncharacterized protein n=1 Tax=Eumeta variegata TaxID=151549 RepID=A0A4C1WNJ1_EUMVA|nr:hypothetical protein EVAR_43331_1 [Eumeta japonica]